MDRYIITVFYRILAGLTMGNFFLPIVFANVPRPFSMVTFYLLVWLISLLVFFPKLFLTKSMMYVYLFIGTYTLFILTGIFSTIELDWIGREMQALFFALLMLQYFVFSKDIKGLLLLHKMLLLFIGITITTSLIGLQQFPLASRDLGGGLAARGEYGLIQFYRSIGIAGYDFFYGLAFAVPVYVSFYRMQSVTVFQKGVAVVFILFVLYGIAQAQFTTALLFALIGLGMALWTSEKVKPAVIRLIILLLTVVLFPQALLADAIFFFAQVPGEGTLQDRLVDLSITTREGLGGDETHIVRRADRIPVLLGHFFNSPIVGGGESLGHNYWLDRLSMVGLLGVIPWFLLIKHQITTNLKRIHKNDQVYYIIVMFLFISMGFIKGMGQTLVQFFIFFIIPSLLFLKGQMKVQKIN